LSRIDLVTNNLLAIGAFFFAAFVVMLVMRIRK